jgi:YD repeat-containing protein
MTDAEGRTTSYTYDGVGNLLSLTDGENNTTSYTYDGLNRMLTDTNQLGYTRIYSYDAAGQLTSISDPDSTYTYTYDANGRLLSSDNLGTTNSPHVVFNYSYDAVGNLVEVRDPIEGVESGIESFTYDELNQATSINQSGNGVREKRVDMSYDAASQMIGVTRYGDLAGSDLVAETVYSYDGAGRLISLVHSGAIGEIANYEWVYDAAHRITRFTSPDGRSDYSYDATIQGGSWIKRRDSIITGRGIMIPL